MKLKSLSIMLVTFFVLSGVGFGEDIDGDTVNGNLTISGYVSVGTTENPTARLDVVQTGYNILNKYLNL